MWYFAQAGQQQGPISDEQIKRMVQDGSLGKEDLVWREGMASWQPAGEVPGLQFPASTFTPAPFSPPPPAPAAPIITPPPPPPEAVAPYAAPQYQSMPTPPTPSYGAPPAYGQAGGADIPDLLVMSIIATVLCCVPGGVAAIIFSTKANNAKKMGDFETARQAAKQAKTWLTVSVVVGLLAGLLGILSGVIVPLLQRH